MVSPMWVCLRYRRVLGYAYLILSSQASTRSGVVGNTVSALTVQSAFLDNFESVVNRRVDIREDIKHYQHNLSYASSKVNYSLRQNIYILPSDMNLKIRSGTVGYNNKILVSDEKFSLGKNDEVNAPAMKSRAQTATNSNDVLGPRTPPHGSHAPAISRKPQEPLALAGGFEVWNMFR